MSAFTQVARPLSGTRRSSALFHYLQSIGFANAPAPDGVVNVFEPTISRSAYILALPMGTQDNIFAQQGYALKERHIRIDQDFTKLTQGLNRDLCTHWHYTETYFKTGSEDISVHVYFHYGLFLQATSKIGDGTPQGLSKAQEHVAKRNAEPARNIILQLLQKVASHKQALDAQYESLATELSDTAHVLELERSNTRISSIAACGRIFRELQEYNEDYIDSRFKMLLRRIESIIEQSNKAVATANVESVVTDQQPKDVEQLAVALEAEKISKTVKAKSEDEIIVEKLKVMHLKLNKYLKEFNAATDAQEILRLAAQQQGLGEELLILYFEVRNEQHQKRVGTYENLLRNAPSVFGKFKQFATDGKSEAAIALFNHVQDSIPSNFYFEFLLVITSPFQKVGSEPGHVALCKHFYANAADYRMLMSMFNSLQSGIPSEDGRSILLSQNILNGSISGSRFDIFKVLCEQSTLNNICGAVIEGKEIPLLDLACSINHTDDRFVEYLLEHGSIPDYPAERIRGSSVVINQTMEHPSISDRDRQNIQRLAGNVNLHNLIKRTYDAGNNEAALFDLSDSAIAPQIPAVRKRYREIANAGSTVTRYISFGKQDPRMIRRLARDTSTSNLIFALARMSIKNIGYMLVLTREKLGVKIVRTKEQRFSQAQVIMSSLPAQGANYAAYFLGEGRMPQANDKLHALHDELEPRLVVTSQANLQRYQGLFQAQARQFEQQGDILHAITANYASLFTLCYCDPSVEVHLRIAQILIAQAELYKQGSFDYLDAESKQGLSYASMVNLNNFLTASRFKQEVQQQLTAPPVAGSTNQGSSLRADMS